MAPLRIDGTSMDTVDRLIYKEILVKSVDAVGEDLQREAETEFERISAFLQSRTITFAVAIKRQEIPSHEDYSEKELKKCWYTDADKEKMQVTKDKTVARIEKGKPAKGSVPYRGLECWTTVGGELLDQHISVVVAAVMDEQDAQWDADSDDRARIAAVSLAATGHSQEKAYRVAAEDERAALLAWSLHEDASQQSSLADDDSLVSSSSRRSSSSKKKSKAQHSPLKDSLHGLRDIDAVGPEEEFPTAESKKPRRKKRMNTKKVATTKIEPEPMTNRPRGADPPGKASSDLMIKMPNARNTAGGSNRGSVSEHNITSTTSSGVSSKAPGSASKSPKRKKPQQIVKSKPQGKVVRFDVVYTRDYERIVGDNPECSSGPPIAIGWAHGKTQAIDIDKFENCRTKRRSELEMILPREERESILMYWGATMHDVSDAVRRNRKVKSQRNQTVSNMGKAERIEEVFESATRKLKRAVLCKKPSKGDRWDNELPREAQTYLDAIQDGVCTPDISLSSAPTEKSL
jgi:hypothetical protein